MIYSKNVRRMKSEKAEELLYRRECGYPYSGYLTTQGAEEVADLAEQEAEERIRAKAIEAFKSSCKYQDGCLGANRKCDKTQCAYLNEFIQKLNEL